MSKARLTPVETLAFVGCVHVVSPEIESMLGNMLHNPPKFLIFGGDVTGCPAMEKFKRIFYNHLNNRARNELKLHEDSTRLSDEEILSYVGNNPPRPGHTLRRGYLDLLEYEMKLGRKNDGGLSNLPPADQDALIASQIREIATYRYFGPWVKTLEESARRGVVASIQENSERLAALIAPIAKKGTQIIMVGGNWDNAQVTRDEMAGPGIDVFDTIPFYRSKGFTLYDEIGTEETDFSFLVFLPYWYMLHYDAEKEQVRINNIKTAVARARAQHKTIIVVGHAQPNWAIHFLQNQDPHAGLNDIDKRLMEHFTSLLIEIAPDEVVYPHQHNPILNADGTEVGINMKYLLRIDGAKLDVVEQDEDILPSSSYIVASYVPFQRLGTLYLGPMNDPRVAIVGGDRDAVDVS